MFASDSPEFYKPEARHGSILFSKFVPTFGIIKAESANREKAKDSYAYEVYSEGITIT